MEGYSKTFLGILILFGGGLALAKGMSSTGIVSLITTYIAEGNFSETFNSFTTHNTHAFYD